MSDILLEIESSLADQENSSNSIHLMLQNLKDDIQDTLNDEMNVPASKISKDEIVNILKHSDDVDVALVCPKCDNFLFANDTDAKVGKLTESSQECCREFFKKSHEISRTNLDYWYHFLNNPFKTIHTLPNYTRFLFYSTEGIPTQLRSRVWGLLLNSSDNFGKINNDWCENLFDNLNDENSPYLRVIVNDLNRIFPSLDYFQNEDLGQANLKNILNAYSLYDAEIGYCQGLPFLIALILFHFKSNPMTFLAAINIFEKKKNLNFKKIFDEKMSGLKLWFYQFDEIFKKHSPELYSHFENLKVDLKLFTSKSFLSFFAVGCPLQILIKLFDVMIIEGFQSSIFKICLIILNKNKEIFLDLNDPEEIHQHLLSKNIWDCYANNLNSIINDILNLNSDLISQDYLNELEEKFHKQESKHLSSPKKGFGHRHSKSTTAASLTVNVPLEKNTNNSSVINNNTFAAPPPAPFAVAGHSRSASNTPMEPESAFFKFFKYGFSNPGSAATTPVVDQAPIMSVDSGKDTAHQNSNISSLSTHSSIDRSSTCSSRDSNIFDQFTNAECDSSSSSTTSPTSTDEMSKRMLVKDIIISSPDVLLEKDESSTSKVGLQIHHNNNSGLNIPHDEDADTSQISASSQIGDQITYLANIPPPNAKRNSSSSQNGSIGCSNTHSRSLSELNDLSLHNNATNNIQNPISNIKRGSHAKNHSLSAFSICSDASSLSNHSLNSSLSPQSHMDNLFPSFPCPSTKAHLQAKVLSENNGGASHNRSHSYSPSISSISSFKQKTRSEMKEMEMSSEIEGLKFKLEIYEKILNDDKKLIKNLFKLYLMKDDVCETGLEQAEKDKLSEKIKKREYKVLKEVEERLRM